MGKFFKVAGYFENVVGVNSISEVDELAIDHDKEYPEYKEFRRNKIKEKHPVFTIDDELAIEEEAKAKFDKNKLPKYLREGSKKNFGYLSKYEALMPHAKYKKNVYTGIDFKNNYLTKEELKKVYEENKSWLENRSKKILQDAINSDYNYFTTNEIQ